MKERKRALGLFAACFAIVLTLALWAGFNPPVSVSAESDYDRYNNVSDYEIREFDTEFVVSANRVIKVTERIAVFFTGYDVHGIIRDFPLGGGVKYRKISAKCENSTDFSPYFHTDDFSFLSYYLGGKKGVTGESRTYLITYEMAVPALGEEGYLPLNLLGYGWYAPIDSFSATVKLPGGLNDEPIVYSGEYGSGVNHVDAKITPTGTNEYRVTAENLGTLSYGGVSPGITVDFSLKAGVLTQEADLSVLYAFLAGAVLIGIVCLVRFIKYRRPTLVKPVNFTAPDEMDPFLMGKLVDDKVDKEDYGALFFYLASKGYAHIDFTENEKDPAVYKTQKEFSDDEPLYCRQMYDALFDGRESVKVSDLSNSFYKTADSMRAVVTDTAGKTYRGTVAPLLLCGVLVLLLLGGFGWLFTLLTVSASYFLWWATFVGCAFAFLIPALGVNYFTRRRYKWKKAPLLFTVLGFFLLGVLFGFLFCLVPSPAFGWGTGFVLTVCAAVSGVLAGGCAIPTKEHSEKLGRILGFKQFIEFADRDRIEFMLKDDPELYYKVLPYAQVLGVTNAWTDKFKGLKISAPAYCTYSSPDFIDCVVWYSLFRSFNHSISSNMVTRPSPKGGYSGGIGKGGFGGGFGGGGFGGGGGRSF